MRTIWYMGAKTRLTDEIVRAVERAAPRARAVLDLMSGTAAVSQALASRYRVVANDVQAYAAAIAGAYLLHGPEKAGLLADLDPERDLGPAYRENLALLWPLLGPAIALEDAHLEAAGLEPEAPDAVAGPVLPGPREPAAAAAWRRRLPRDPAERARAYRAFALEDTPTYLEDRDPPLRGPFAAAAGLCERSAVAARRAAPRALPYALASGYYGNVYLGLRQCAAVDSLRCAIDRLEGPLAAARRRHYLAALLHAVSVSTSATSHFCQPRGLTSDHEVRAVQERRSLSIPSLLASYSAAMADLIGRTPHRPGNAVLQGDWRDVLARWDEVDADVVYADPPYTQDNYSRFYHALEVLTAYDYPPLQVGRSGVLKGRYPALGARHRSGFCAVRQVEREVRELVEAVAARGAGLVLSYGAENGLLLRRWRAEGDTPARALERFAGLARGAYREVELVQKVLLHSGQGDSNRPVTELLLVAREPRARRSRGRWR